MTVGTQFPGGKRQCNFSNACLLILTGWRRFQKYTKGSLRRACDSQVTSQVLLHSQLPRQPSHSAGQTLLGRQQTRPGIQPLKDSIFPR